MYISSQSLQLCLSFIGFLHVRTDKLWSCKFLTINKAVGKSSLTGKCSKIGQFMYIEHFSKKT